MKSSVALGASIACALLATALVGLDYSFNLEVTLETRDASGAWVLVAGNARDPYGQPPARPGVACAGPDLRLVVHNGQLVGADVDVTVTEGSYYGPGAPGPRSILKETWSLGQGETRTHEFTVPADSFRETEAPDGSKVPGSVDITVQVGRDIYLNTCVQKEAVA